MRRLHVIDDPDFIGGGLFFRDKEEEYMRDPELYEAYKAGCKKGYKKAMKEMEDEYEERRATHWGGDGSRILYRRDDRDRMYDDDDDIQWRRRRDSRGRYTN